MMSVHKEDLELTEYKPNFTVSVRVSRGHERSHCVIDNRHHLYLYSARLQKKQDVTS